MARKRDVSKKTGRRPSKAQDMIPKGYHELLTQIKERIRTAQLRACAGCQPGTYRTLLA